MKPRNWAVFACMPALVAGMALPAHAAEPAPTVIATLDSVTRSDDSPATAVLRDVANVATTEGGSKAINAQVADIKVEIPTDPETPLALTDVKDGAKIGVTLPFAADAAPAEREAAGVVSFDNGNSSTSVPVVKSDGGLQITSILSSEAAPTEYPYTLTIPEGAHLEESSGSIFIIDGRGRMVAGIAPAWAKDADGKDVPTHYVVAGSVVTQVVDHKGGAFRYPIVADPFMGQNLLKGVWVNRSGSYKYLGGNTYSTMLSTWGAIIWTGAAGGPVTAAAGNKVIQDSGWNEFVSRGGRNTTSIHQQYLCHVVFGYDLYHAGVHWDFEEKRPVRNNWLTRPDKCNWTTS